MAVLLGNAPDFYLSTVESGFTASDTYKLTLVSGYSMSYSTGVKKATNPKIGAIPERLATQVFDEVSEVSLDITTYIKPYKDGSLNHTAVEKFLLESLFDNSMTESTSQATIGYASSYSLPKLYLWMYFDGVIYKINEVVVDKAIFNMDIGQIATIDWKLKGLSFEKATTNLPSDGTYSDLTNQDNYIRTKLSTVSLLWNSKNYLLPFTNGTIEISNGVKFVKRKTLDVRVSLPLSHYTTFREIKGSLTCYIHSGNNGTQALYDDMLQETFNSSATIDSNANFTIYIGGENNSHVKITIPQGLLTLPKINLDDVLSTEISFSSRESSIGANDDITVVYKVV